MMLVGDKMKVFISWAGDKSLKVAKILKDWIPCVIQDIQPYFSTEDIDKGARWSSDIAKELSDADFGILCVTKDNLESQWLNFEAGALSKALDKVKVCPFLFDLKPSEISNSPILQFQMTNVDRDDIFKLFKTMNKGLGEKGLEETRLEKMFELSWPKIDKELKSIEDDISNYPQKESSNQNEIMEEMLDLLRSQQIILRDPEKLLPIKYLEMVMNSRTNIDKIPRRMLSEWSFLRTQVIESIGYSGEDNKISRFIEFIELTDKIFFKIGLINNIRMPYKFLEKSIIENNDSE